MKILALMTFDIFRLSLGEALQQLGHEVKFLGEFDEDQLDAEIRAYRPDMVVDMGWDVWQQDKHVHHKLEPIREVIRRHGIFHLYFAEEDWLHFERWSKRYCSIMRPSFVLTRSPLTIRHYEELGIKASYLDVGCNPSFHTPGPVEEAYRCDVALVANGNFTIGELRYKSIHDLVLPLLDQSKYSVKIWGKHWGNIDWCYPGKKVSPAMLQGKLPFPETPSVYRSAKINISIQTSHDQLSNRTMDIMACGGFLLTSNTKAVREKLRPGVNCATSSSPEETIRLIEHYLQHDEERRRIAHEGYKLATEQFAYQVTLSKIWPEIEQAWKEHRRRSGIPTTAPMNLLRDGQFLEANKAWVAHNATSETSLGYGASGSMKFHGGADNAYIQQKVPVTPGQSYLLTAWFATSATGPGAPVHIFVQYYTKDNQLLGFGLYHILFVTDMTETWFPYRGITTAVPPDASYAWVLINKVPHEHSESLLVSDCKMIEYTT